ncbi:hypothetical protein [Marinicellulosiphila megalodicopiae]|uniref:hypothetical protein n=1 Tax=Marinicellulosiphila megalodicopiae TaxID=2724896 RepID=UPI003BB0465D
MQAILDNIQSPFLHLLVYCAVLVFIALVSRLSALAIVIGGVSLISVWMLVGSIYAIGQTISWYYCLQLAGCLLVGYVFLWLLALAADEWGRCANGDGFMVILAPLSAALLIFFPSMAIKGIWQVLRLMF